MTAAVDFIVDYRTRKNTKCVMLCTFASRDFYFCQKRIFMLRILQLRKEIPLSWAFKLKTKSNFFINKFYENFLIIKVRMGFAFMQQNFEFHKTYK